MATALCSRRKSFCARNGLPPRTALLAEEKAMTYELDALRAKVPMRGVRIFDQPRIFDRQC